MQSALTSSAQSVVSCIDWAAPVTEMSTSGAESAQVFSMNVAKREGDDEGASTMYLSRDNRDHQQPQATARESQVEKTYLEGCRSLSSSQRW